MNDDKVNRRDFSTQNETARTIGEQRRLKEIKRDSVGASKASYTKDCAWLTNNPGTKLGKGDKTVVVRRNVQCFADTFAWNWALSLALLNATCMSCDNGDANYPQNPIRITSTVVALRIGSFRWNGDQIDHTKIPRAPILSLH
jgi:hypothetical protein